MNGLRIMLFLVTALTVGCENPETTRYPLHVQDTVFYVELADSPEERQRGLMHRQSLASDHGMLFIFSDSQVRSFWMRNTYIDLSIAYIDSNGVIIDILDMEALDETPVRSSLPAQYALEVNKGAFRGIYPGNRVDFRDIPLP